MKTITGRYMFWDIVTINIIELTNGECLFLPDHTPVGWTNTKERALQLIKEGQFVYLEPYQPIKPKKYIPSLELRY